MRSPKRVPIIAAVFAFAMLLLASGKADAQPRILRPSTRPMWFAGGIGPEFFGLNSPGRYGRYRGYFGRFKMNADFGYHFSGRFEGPAIGATIEQSFGDGFAFMLNPGFKFWWDIEIADMAIYIAPFAKAGYALATGRNYRGTCFDARGRPFPCGGRSRVGHFFNIAVGAEGRVVLHNRGLLFFRPVQVDTYLGPDEYWGDPFIIGYSILLGGGVVF